MSAQEAWPRRPPGGRTRLERSPTMNLDGSSGGDDSGMSSPAQGAFAAGSTLDAFGPRLDLPHPRRDLSPPISARGGEEEEEELLEQAIKYRHEGTRLDKAKVARIAMAFGMAISPTVPSPSHASSSAALLHPPSSASTQQSRGGSTRSSSSSSLSSFPPSSPFATSPFVSSTHPSPFAQSQQPRLQPLLSIQPPSNLSSSPTLLPLLPTLKAQLSAIAKEFQLPSTVGLVLYLQYDQSSGGGQGEARIGEGIWEIIWRDYLLAPTPTATKPSSSPSSNRQTSRDLVDSSLSHSVTPSARLPRPVDPSESLLSRTPSTLPPASLRNRTRSARSSPSTPISASKTGFPARKGGRSGSAELESSTANRTTADSPIPPSSEPSTPSSPTPPRTKTFSHRLPSSSFPSPLRSSSSAASAMGKLSIAGTLEWDVDERGASLWFERWLGRKGLEKLVRPTGGWLRLSNGAGSGRVESESESEPGEEEEEDGYARLSEDEADGEVDDERSVDDETDDSTPAAFGRDPLADVFPSAEVEFAALRDGRGEETLEQEEGQEEEDIAGRSRQGSMGTGLGLGLGLGFGQGEVQERRSRDLEGLPVVRGLNIHQGSDDDDDEAEGTDHGLREIEELLKQHAPLQPTPPAVVEPVDPMTTVNPPVSTTGLPPTPLKQRRKSSASGPSGPSSTSINPLNLTLAITSPKEQHFPTLVTSPTATSVFSPTGSDATNGGLAYLRGAGSQDSYASSGPSDGMLSAAIDGAFGPGGKRGSALIMQDSLADLERVVRSLSPRDLKIPNRDRPVPYSPGASSLSPAPSGSSFAVFPSPAFSRSEFMTPNGSPSIATTSSSPRNGADVQSAGPRLRENQTLGREEREKASLSIASSFMDSKAAAIESPVMEKKPDLEVQTDDLPAPVWPAVPVSPGSPLLSDVPLPLRKDSPMSSPRITSPVPSRFDGKQRMSSASSIASTKSALALGSPLSPLGGQIASFPFPQPAVSSPLQSSSVEGRHSQELDGRVDRSESISTVNSKGGGSRFRNFVWGRAASSGSVEDSGLSSPTTATGFSTATSPSSTMTAFPGEPHRPAGPATAPAVPRHQSIPESRGKPPSRISATPSGRSVSDTSALEVVNQFGKFQLTPDMASSGFQGQDINFPSPPTGSTGKSTSGGKKRFRAQFSPGNLFGKNKKQLEISAPEIGEPLPQAHVPFHHRQRSLEEKPTSPVVPLSPRKVSEGNKVVPSVSQSFSARSLASSALSPPGSPTSTMSPRSVKRKPVPSQATSMGPHRDLQRSFSEDSSLSIVPSIQETGPPLPPRSTSLGQALGPSPPLPSTPTLETIPQN